jgi:hypothetical protein
MRAMNDIELIASRKREERAKQARELGELCTDAKRVARRRRQCFWTWPWGHVYTWGTGECVGCGRNTADDRVEQ